MLPGDNGEQGQAGSLPAPPPPPVRSGRQAGRRARQAAAGAQQDENDQRVTGDRARDLFVADEGERFWAIVGDVGALAAPGLQLVLGLREPFLVFVRVVRIVGL